MAFQKIQVPTHGTAIQLDEQGALSVPHDPIIPYIEGDGIGVDITPVMRRVVDEAVSLAYGTRRKVVWMEIFAGEKANRVYGEPVWLPQETLKAIKEFRVAIKGPLTTPVGGGIRSINVALRQELDLYTCLRPIRYFDGTPSPVKHPELTNMVIFRENSEDIYAGIEWQAGTQEVRQVVDFLRQEMGVTNIRFPETCGIGVKPVSREGTRRLVRRAIQYAITHRLPSVTLVHKGNIMKFTEGAFRDWGYELAQESFAAAPIDGGPWQQLVDPHTGHPVIIKDVIADAFLQQILTRPADYSVIATLNLNGDYISDALAAIVGGIGIAPGANMNDSMALFEATHGTAPKYAGQDKVNPGSLILSAEMMLRHLGWNEAADHIIAGVGGAIAAGKVTYDFARLMPGAATLTCSAFGEAMVQHMQAAPKLAR